MSPPPGEWRALYLAMEALRYSLRKRAMLTMEMSLGHAAWHSPWLEQPPKPFKSISSTMRSTRRSRSGWPCGSSDNCATLAPTNNAADALGHAATQAPQLMHAAASIASSAMSFGIGIALASGAEPALTEM